MEQYPHLLMLSSGPNLSREPARGTVLQLSSAECVGMELDSGAEETATVGGTTGATTVMDSGAEVGATVGGTTE